jgi:XTP/dITP diphosphohydrolase
MLRFVTTNQGKVREAREYLGDGTVEQLDFDYTEIQADDLVTVAAHGAREAYRHAQEPVLVDDAGLFVDAFDGFPGPYSSYVEDTVGVERVWRLTREEDDRSASFKTVLAYCDGEGFDASPEPVDHETRTEDGSRDERTGSGATRERRGQDQSTEERAAATTDDQVATGDLPVKIFEGYVPGEIVAPRGEGGFGYDPIFEHDGTTFAEMTPEEKNAVSHRGRALAKFGEWYRER